MPKFNLSGMAIISIYTEVEADTLEEAIEIAECRGIERGEWGDIDQKTQAWISEEYDGGPMNIRQD